MGQQAGPRIDAPEHQLVAAQGCRGQCRERGPQRGRGVARLTDEAVILDHQAIQVRIAGLVQEPLPLDKQAEARMAPGTEDGEAMVFARTVAVLDGQEMGGAPGRQDGEPCSDPWPG